LNRLLSRQIKRAFGKDYEPSPEMQKFFETINSSYDHFEKDRAIIERAMKISSEELRRSYEKLIIQKELERKNVELERFVAIASHDLKAPLKNIKAFSTLINKRMMDHPDYPKYEEFLEIIISNSDRMDNLIGDLLTYSRVGKKDIKEEWVDLKQVMITVNKNMRTIIDENNGFLEFNNLPTVKGIPHQMLQLFQNLVGNALKFRKKDMPPVVKVGAKEEDGEFVFYIEDNGIGMDKEDLEKVFDAFQRLENSKDYAGSGLGLSICKSIVEKSGGRIWVESQRDIGSTFLFSIPKEKVKTDIIFEIEKMNN